MSIAGTQEKNLELFFLGSWLLLPIHFRAFAAGIKTVRSPNAGAS
jgi:hypothetical protein